MDTHHQCCNQFTTLSPKLEAFIRDRQYLYNVSARTVEWYREALSRLPNESPSQNDLDVMVIEMRQRGLRATSVNSWARAINCFLKASGSSNFVKRLKEPSNVPPVFNERQIQALIAFKGRSRTQRRLHTMILLLFDTGARISSVTGLRVESIDFDNLLVRFDGKGAKQYVVPISFELRKALWKYISAEGLQSHQLVFGTSHGTQMTRRNVLRDVTALCRQLGFDPPRRGVHAFRHTFAVNYIRRGGSVFHLQKALNHSTLEMSRRYASLSTDDLSAVHNKVSLLSHK